MDIAKRIENRMYPQDVSDGTYLVAHVHSGAVYIGDVKNTDNGQRFIRYTTNPFTDSTSAVEVSSEPLSHYILISRVEEDENGC